jgi:hypothetical protein
VVARRRRPSQARRLLIAAPRGAPVAPVEVGEEPPPFRRWKPPRRDQPDGARSRQRRRTRVEPASAQLFRSERIRPNRAQASKRRSSKWRSPPRRRRGARRCPEAFRLGGLGGAEVAILRIRAVRERESGVDGRDVGVTPIERLQVDAGARVVRVLREGYLPWEDTFRARAGRTETIEAELTARVAEPEPAPEPEPAAPEPPRVVEGRWFRGGAGGHEPEVHSLPRGPLSRSGAPIGSRGSRIEFPHR